MTPFLKSLIPDPIKTVAREAYYRLEPSLYAGSAVECPCCGASFRRFLPTGRPERYARCGKCGGVERHRLLRLYLENSTNLFSSPLRLLHFAPEGIFRDLFSSLPNVKYTSVDYCQPSDAHMDIMKLAFPDNSFDAIVCIHVLEHIPDDLQAMRELHRVLRSGGWAILQVPIRMESATTYEDPTITDPAQRRIHFGQEDHVRWYGRDYAERLKRAGFTVKIDGYVRELDVERYGLDPTEDVYRCGKL